MSFEALVVAVGSEGGVSFAVTCGELLSANLFSVATSAFATVVASELFLGAAIVKLGKLLQAEYEQDLAPCNNSNLSRVVRTFLQFKSRQ